MWLGRIWNFTIFLNCTILSQFLVEFWLLSNFLMRVPVGLWIFIHSFKYLQFLIFIKLSNIIKFVWSFLTPIYNASINTKFSALKYPANASFPVSIKSTKYSYKIAEIRYQSLFCEIVFERKIIYYWSTKIFVYRGTLSC